MEISTHPKISPSLVGEPVEIEPGRARARLKSNEVMAADEHGLVHGGFTFGLADYCAMLAINHPHVVLGGAETRFLAPVKVGEIMTAAAEVVEEEGRKYRVECSVNVDERTVFTGVFTCFVLEQHVLDLQGV